MDVVRDVFLLVGQVSSSLFWSAVHFLWPPKMKDIAGQLVLIIGDNKFSQQMALCFASRGARVVTWCALNEDINEASDVSLVKLDDLRHVIRTDWRNTSKAEESARKITSALGQVNLLVSCVIPSEDLSFLQADNERIAQTFQHNFFFPLWVMKYFGAQMLQRRHGHLVTITTSEYALDVSSHMTRCSTSAAWVGLADTLGSEVVFSKDCGLQNTYAVIDRSFDEKVTAERIVQGVVTNQKQVFIPRILYWLSFIKTLLPLESMQLIYRWRKKQEKTK